MIVTAVAALAGLGLVLLGFVVANLRDRVAVLEDAHTEMCGLGDLIGPEEEEVGADDA